MRLLFCLLLFSLAGCSSGRQVAIPVMKPIERIVAITFDVPDMDLKGFAVEVPVDQMAIIAKLVTPTELCKQQIKRDIHYHVADLQIEHTDGSTTTLRVHWTGHNPAAVSLDERTFYYGGVDEAPDGAMRLIQLLRSYKNDLVRNPSE